MTTSGVPLSEFGATHLMGIGGAGMSVIAQLLAARGVVVTGCDRADSPAAEQLRAHGISVRIGHDPDHVAGADTLVISTAVRGDNPEVLAAREAGMRVLHRSEALAALMAGQRAVAVAGTHGKTTTTAMLAAALHVAGVDASVAIGARLASGGLGAHCGISDIFIAEADESDGSFLRYSPDIAVITNLEPDHLDFYGSPQAVNDAFLQFVAGMPVGGVLVACADDAGAAALARQAPDHVRTITYGQDPSADVVVQIVGREVIVPTTPGASDDGEVTALELQMPGQHNALNATAAWIVARLLRAQPRGAAAGLTQFSGAERRFEIRGTGAGLTIVDDYAHHPTEVRAVLSAARDYLVQEGRAQASVVAVFQPHLPSRTRLFAAEFASALQLADCAVVLDVFLAREDPDPSVSAETILSQFSSDFEALHVRDVSQLARYLAAQGQDGDIVLLLGAGDISTWSQPLIAALEGQRS